MPDELLDIVNENDEVIGVKLKRDVYAEGHSNRIVHIFVLHPETNHIYIQRRAGSVSYRPNHLCTSAAGHVSAGETYEAAAARELKEEIGIEAPLTFVRKFRYHCSEGDAPILRFIALYITYAADGFVHDAHEVSDGFFVSKEELERVFASEELVHPQMVACWGELQKQTIPC